MRRSPSNAEYHPRFAGSAVVLMSALAALAGPACGADGESAGAEIRAADVTPENWGTAIESKDAAVRVAAVNAIPGAPGPDGAVVLERIAQTDPDARVREQAVLAVTQVSRKDAMALLKEVALTERSADVAAAARASFHMLREQFPEPQRGFLTVVPPKHAAPGDTFDVRVHLGSSAPVPRAKLFLQVPEGFVVVAPERGMFDGTLDADVEQVVTFSVRADRDARLGDIEAHAILSYDLVEHEELRVVHSIQGEP